MTCITLRERLTMALIAAGRTPASIVEDVPLLAAMIEGGERSITVPPRIVVSVSAGR